MKRIILFFICCLMLVLSACAVEKENDIRGTVNGNVEEAAENAETSLSIGRIEGGTYTNEYIGFACNLDDSWSYCTAAELENNLALSQEMMADLESLEGTALEDAIASNEKFYDMKAECIEDMTTISVLYEKLSMQSRLEAMQMTDQQIIEGLFAQSDMLKKAYEEMGLEDVEMVMKTVDYLSEKRNAILTSAKVQGINYYCLQILDFKLGSYGATITFTSFYEDKTEELAKMFYVLE